MFILDLAETHQVVRYDRPGVGMSGRDDRPFDLDSEAAYLRAVIDAGSADEPVDVPVWRAYAHGLAMATRLVGLSRALLGWLPGGLGLVAVSACAAA